MSNRSGGRGLRAMSGDVGMEDGAIPELPTFMTLRHVDSLLSVVTIGSPPVVCTGAARGGSRTRGFGVA